MTTRQTSDINRPYLIGVLSLLFVLPLLSFFIERLIDGRQQDTVADIGKWFLFYVTGFRLFLAGIRQIFNPAFTLKDIFHIEGSTCFPILKELGFANVCAGLIGILSLFFPSWRIVSAFGSGLYYGLAGINHYLKKPAGANEKFALITDIIVFILLASYVALFINA